MKISMVVGSGALVRLARVPILMSSKELVSFLELLGLAKFHRIFL